MITALKRLTLAAADPAAAIADYADLLGQPPAEGVFRLANVDLAIETAAADEKDGLRSLTFAVDDLARAARTLENRDVACKSCDGPDGGGLLLDIAATHGVSIALEAAAPRDTRREQGPALAPPGAVVALDHVVIRSTQAQRALAFYGAQLGLSLRFDRRFSQMGTRVSLFRCGDMKVEIASPASEAADAAAHEQQDALWGVSWRADDIAATHARLSGRFETSPVRKGLQPGSSVFTIRNRTHGVATIVIAAEKQR